MPRRSVRRKKSQKRIRGGSIVAQGADTCVFSPRVRCKQQDQEVSLREREMAGIPQVSRLIRDPSQVDTEVRAMEYLKFRISTIQEEFWNLFLTDHFLVATSYCTAEFLREDEQPEDQFMKCIAEGNQILLQTEQFQKELFDLLSPQKLKEVDESVAQICLAFLKLNQTSEYLFVHNDFHAGNIGIANGISRINDFGRSFLWPVQDSLEGQDYLSDQSRKDLILNMNQFFPAYFFPNESSKVETQAFVQMIPEVRVIIQIANLLPVGARAIAQFQDQPSQKLVRQLQDLYNAYSKEFNSRTDIKTLYRAFQDERLAQVQTQSQLEGEYLFQQYQLCTYIFKFSDLFGLLFYILRNGYFVEQDPSNFLEELQTLQFTKFQGRTLTENDIWKLICKYNLGKFLCKQTASADQMCSNELCKQNFNRFSLSQAATGF